jgi:hypothetical protein
MEELRMSKFRRNLALLSLGGMTLAIWGGVGGLGGCAPFFAQNDPYTQFLVDVGNYGIDTGVDGALTNVPTRFNDWVNTPITKVYQSIWTAYIRHEYAPDPTFSKLLVE